VSRRPASSRCRISSARSTGSHSCTSAIAMSCATSSCSGSSRRTSTTPRRRGRRAGVDRDRGREPVGYRGRRDGRRRDRAARAPPHRLRPRRRDVGARSGARVSVTTPPRRERDRRPRLQPLPGPGRAPRLIDSFNYAAEGIIHVLRTQRNLRIHFLIAIVVIGAAIALGVQRLELIALLLAIAFVLVAEMVNTAIEGAIDVSTTSFDPNAKLAKDVAAGA